MSDTVASSEEPGHFAPATPLPDFLSPVFVKELRQGLRAHRFVLPFVSAQIMAVIAVGTELGVTSALNASGSGGDFAEFLGGIVYLVVWLIIGVVMPLTNLNALRPELSGGRNVELLLMSNLDRWQIVRGKWLVGFTLSGLMLVSLLPYLLTRYFVGGVDLVDNLRNVFQIFLVNAVGTALAIGASGFGNLIGRILILGIGGLSYVATVFGASWMLIDKMGSSTGSGSLWTIILFFGVSMLVTALYAAFGLQLGRSRLRLFENPLDPPASGLVIALMIFTPIVVAVTAAATDGYGGWVAVIGLLVLALLIDRGPGRDSAIRYAQP